MDIRNLYFEQVLQHTRSKSQPPRAKETMIVDRKVNEQRTPLREREPIGKVATMQNKMGRKLPVSEDDKKKNSRKRLLEDKNWYIYFFKFVCVCVCVCVYNISLYRFLGLQLI